MYCQFVLNGVNVSNPVTLELKAPQKRVLYLLFRGRVKFLENQFEFIIEEISGLNVGIDRNTGQHRLKQLIMASVPLKDPEVVRMQEWDSKRDRIYYQKDVKIPYSVKI